MYIFRLQHAVQITNAQFQPPAFTGFNAKAVEPNKSYQTVIGGREFGVIEVTYILVPMETAS